MNRPLLTFTLLAAPALAQSEGPLMGCPIYMTVAPNTLGPAGSLAAKNFYYKRAGFYDLTRAMAPASATRPDFSMAKMFPMLVPGPLPFRFNAVSSGYCTVFCNYEGGDPVLRIPTPNTWGALLFSVSKDTTGGSSVAVATEATAPEGAGADLFSVVLPESDLPAALSCVPIGEAQRASDSSEMGFNFMPGQQPEMLDVDPYFTFYRCADPIPSYLQPDPWLYFSLPQAIINQASSNPTLAGIITPWFGGTPRRAGTILRMQWLSGSSVWTVPEVFLTAADLGLRPGDDIDALSVDENSGLVLLSLARRPAPLFSALEDQLLVAAYSVAGSAPSVTIPVRPYYYDDGTDTKVPMGEIAGANGGGEIDGTCEIDPSRSNGPGAIVFGYLVACRTDLPFGGPPWPTTMSASAFATAPAASGMRSHAVSVSGMPAGGLGGVVIGVPAPGGGPTLGLGGGSLLFLPAPASTTYEWSVPARLSPLNMPVDFQWAATDLTNIYLAPTVRVEI